MNGKRTPAIYRLDDGEPPDRITESLVWIVAVAPQVASLRAPDDEPDQRVTEPKYKLMALVVFGNGSINLVPAWMLEVVNWSDNDEALTMALPPDPKRDKAGHILHGNHTSCDQVQDAPIHIGSRRS